VALIHAISGRAISLASVRARDAELAPAEKWRDAP
jgi:hypothetical protein